jgi:hypothetical protein
MLAQSSQRLANGVKGGSHRSTVDLSLAGSNGAHSVSVSKEFQDGKGGCIYLLS